MHAVGEEQNAANLKELVEDQISKVERRVAPGEGERLEADAHANEELRLMAWTETAVPPNPWVSTAGEPPSVWTPSPTCGVTVDVTVQQKTQTLYYIAATGQTQFSLSAADMLATTSCSMARRL